MKRRHFEALRPVCPACKATLNQEHPLKITVIEKEDGDHLIEGVLQCTHNDCLYEYPVIDGVPILVPDARAYITNHIFHLIARDDLGAVTQSMLGECCGPGSNLDATRQHLSSYAWDHYGEFDPQEPPGDPRPGSIARVLDQGLSLIGGGWAGPVIDAGCSVGRSTFELAQRSDDLVLGVDLNFSMLRLAAGVLHRGVVGYPRRRVGMVYDQRRFPVEFKNMEHVDFWACDATVLPFPAGTFATAVNLNLLDCAYSPLDLLGSLRRVLKKSGQLLLATPYDWSSSATPPEHWIGGHSPRSPEEGDSSAVLRSLLTPGAHATSIEGLHLTGELEDVAWHVRLHDRSVATYKLHLLAATVGEQASFES